MKIQNQKIQRPYYYPMHKTVCFVGHISDYSYNNYDNSKMIQNIASEIEHQHFYHNMSYIIVNGIDPSSLLVCKAIEQLKNDFDNKIEIKAIAFIPFRKSFHLDSIKMEYINTINALYNMIDEIYIVDDTTDNNIIVEKEMIDKSQVLIVYNPTQTNYETKCIEYAKENNKDILEKDFTPEYHVYKITVANSMTCYIKAKSQKDAETKAINLFYERKPEIKTEIDDNATPETTLL